MQPDHFESDGRGVLSDLIYQIVTDRFYRGAGAGAGGRDELCDPSRTNWTLYWGGDFQGIGQKLDYLHRLGVTTLWISPPMQNIRRAALYDGQRAAGYHGYWPRDFKRPDEHFGSWDDFEQLVRAAHARGMKLVIDWVPNHTSPVSEHDRSFAEDGALYDDGVPVGRYSDDPDQRWHHFGYVDNWYARFDIQYKNIYDLADLSQENRFVDRYLKESLLRWLDSGIDGVRIDAVAHMPQGWVRSFADFALRAAPLFIFGEWYTNDHYNPLYEDNVRFANTSGVTLQAFCICKAIRDTFALNESMYQLHQAVSRYYRDYQYRNQLVTFIDNHDMPRFLNMNPSRDALHQAIAFLLTTPGIPCIYYGTEQYLCCGADGGNTPYNRQMMDSWDEDTRMFRLIQRLSRLRREHPALRYGLLRERWLSQDIYIYEQTFGRHAVVVAMNKSDSQPWLIEHLFTALPAGHYPDHLGGALGGCGVDVTRGDGENRIAPLMMRPRAVCVWVYRDDRPQAPAIGGVFPLLTQPGRQVVVEGLGFGGAGALRFGAAEARVVSWSDERIVAETPAIQSGRYALQVLGAGAGSNAYDITVLARPQKLVTFVLNDVPCAGDDELYLTGSCFECGQWSTDRERAVGPLLSADGVSWFVAASVPLDTRIEFKFIRIAHDHAVAWEQGDNRVYQAVDAEAEVVCCRWRHG